MAWDILDNDDLGADKILTTGTMNALYDNPTAQAKREANTPSFVQVPVVEKLTAASGNWTWPDGVTAATFWIQAGGGGGGGGSGDGGDAADSTITYNSITTTAEGGFGGTRDGLPFTGGQGGNDGGGDFSVRGKSTVSINGGSSFFGEGGTKSTISTPAISPYQGGGGGGEGQGGGGGEMVRKRVVRVDGLNTVAYVNGAAGTAGSGGTQQAGAAGFILVEY